MGVDVQGGARGSAIAAGVCDYLLELFIVVAGIGAAALTAEHAVDLPFGVPAACHFFKLFSGHLVDLGDFGLEAVVVQLLIGRDFLLY